MNAEDMMRIHNISGPEFYKRYSQSFGPEGRGVKYNIYKRLSTGENVNIATTWARHVRPPKSKNLRPLPKVFRLNYLNKFY